MINWGSTVERHPVGKLVQQCFGEAPRVKLSKPTQSKPNAICDRSVKPEKLFEDIRVKHAHDRTGELVESSSSSIHIVKEQFVPEENRDIASFNANNEFKSCNRRGEHRLRHPRSAEFNSETITRRQRSQLDSEDREPPSATSTSK